MRSVFELGDGDPRGQQLLELLLGREDGRVVPP